MIGSGRCERRPRRPLKIHGILGCQRDRASLLFAGGDEQEPQVAARRRSHGRAPSAPGR